MRQVKESAFSLFTKDPSTGCSSLVHHRCVSALAPLYSSQKVPALLAVELSSVPGFVARGEGVDVRKSVCVCWSLQIRVGDLSSSGGASRAWHTCLRERGQSLPGGWVAALTAFGGYFCDWLLTAPGEQVMNQELAQVSEHSIGEIVWPSVR